MSVDYAAAFSVRFQRLRGNVEGKLAGLVFVLYSSASKGVKKTSVPKYSMGNSRKKASICSSITKGIEHHCALG